LGQAGDCVADVDYRKVLKFKKSVVKGEEREEEEEEEMSATVEPVGIDVVSLSFFFGVTIFLVLLF
jgi:hypothetical protein